MSSDGAVQGSVASESQQATWWSRLPLGTDMTSRVNLSPELMQAVLEQMVRQRGAIPGGNDAAAPSSGHQQESGTETVSITMDTGTVSPGAEASAEAHAHSHSHEQNGQTTSADSVPMARLLALLQTNGIFLAILLLKLLADHMLGVLLFLGLVGCSWHADSVLVNQIGLRESKRCGLPTLKYLWVIFFCCLDIACLYYFFAEQKLYRSLYMMLPDLERYDFFDLLWVVVLTDYATRLATIAVKAGLSLVPPSVLLCKRRGKYYSLIEEISQFYRLLLPMHPWITFLFAAGSHSWFSVLLFIAYFIAKVHSLWTKSKEVFATVMQAMVTVNYGVRARPEDAQAAGDSCSICHDVFNDPVLLKCKHVFCEDCVAMWLDRESTCPMCRATVGDRPKWRDGSTTNVTQFY